ncbi:MAG: hypothetical protein CL571_04255 [Alphaproteobacteria bacterium]|mgnify:FL=1|nr:hypothetical protein [Alphaproteobacteria bacterium]
MKNKRVKIENFSNLEKDTNTNAVINVDQQAYQKYMFQKESRVKQNNTIEELKREIEELKKIILYNSK